MNLCDFDTVSSHIGRHVSKYVEGGTIGYLFGYEGVFGAIPTNKKFAV